MKIVFIASKRGGSGNRYYHSQRQCKYLKMARSVLKKDELNMLEARYLKHC